jgi:hypothetical protein
VAWARILVVALLAAGCGSSTTGELPTWCPSDDCVGMPADLPRTGTIHATDGCIWMEIEGQKASTLWPPNFTATFAPDLEVLDDSGNTIITGDGHSLVAVMLGPRSAISDPCGLGSVVEIFFPTTEAR